MFRYFHLNKYLLINWPRGTFMSETFVLIFNLYPFVLPSTKYIPVA
jgi:hypothetical protein